MPRVRHALVIVACAMLATVAVVGTSDAQAGLQYLGPSLALRQETVWCQNGFVACPIWIPLGFSFGDRPELPFARAFARIPRTGRIVAAHDWSGSSGVLFTDDLGASWQPGRWDWRQAANALAFDAETSFGIAVGDGGYVWNTDDGGETWRDRGSSSGTTYTNVAVVGRLAVIVDARGGVWVSRDGGFDRDLFVEDPSAQLATGRDAIVVRTSSRTYAVHRDGRTELRARRAP